MREITLQNVNNQQITFQNEDGRTIVWRLHTFRGITYASMWVDDMVIYLSEPQTGLCNTAHTHADQKYGFFMWTFPGQDEVYPAPENYGKLAVLMFVEPSYMTKAAIAEFMNGNY